MEDFEWCGLKHYNSDSFSRFKPRHLSGSKKHMTRPVSIFLSSLFILGMIQLSSQTYAQSPKTITNSVGMKLVLIPKGTFTMGSPIEEEGADNDEEQHQVTISKDYYLGVTEVTQGQYEKVMGTNPSYFQKRVIGKSDSSMYPVEQVSWEDAVEFCKKVHFAWSTCLPRQQLPATKDRSLAVIASITKQSSVPMNSRSFHCYESCVRS